MALSLCRPGQVSDCASALFAQLCHCLGVMDSFRRGDLLFDVIDTGPADGPVVILLHGFPQFADSWAMVSRELNAAGYRCLAPNQRGYSPNARPRGRRAYRMPELVEDVR